MLFLKSEGILDWAKAHLTYPRSGYVPAPSLLEGIESSKDQRKLPRALFMLDATVYLFFIVFAMFSLKGHSIHWSVVLAVTFCFLFVTAMVAIRQKQRLSELAFSGGPALFALLCTLLLKPVVPIMFGITVYGVGLLIVGLLRLTFYLVHNPRPNSAEPRTDRT